MEWNTSINWALLLGINWELVIPVSTVHIQYYLKPSTLLRNERNVKNLTKNSKRL